MTAGAVALGGRDPLQRNEGADDAGLGYGKTKKAEGGVAIGTNGAADRSDQSAKGNDVFRRLREAREKADYSSGDWMVESFSTAPPKLNYLTSHDVYSRVVYYRILEPLATYDLGTLKLVPHLASSWQMADDNLSLDVQLRRDVTFADGEPMDADDVVYSWQLQMSPSTARQ